MSAAEIITMPPAPPVAPSVTPMALLQIAMSKDADTEKLTRLMELHMQWEANEARKAFHAAMAQFKLNAPKITKNKNVDYTPKNGGMQVKYDYASLDNVNEQIIPALAAVGISHKWKPSNQVNGSITITCILTHSAGHSEETTLTGPLDTSGNKDAIKSIGSSCSYLERYTLLSATGLATAGVDDDGGKSEDNMQPATNQPPCPIRNAANLDDLKKAYRAAYGAAEAAGDRKAMDSIIAAKDARKKELDAK